MPTTIDDLANALQGFFATKFPTSTSGGPGSVLLVLDQLGTPLDAVEFTGSGTDTATNLLAHQRAAQLADQIPAANALASGWYLARSGSRLSRWYQQLVEASSSSSPDPTAIGAFAVLKQGARELFANAQLNVVSGGAMGGSTGTVDPSGTIDNYYATTMSPVDWFEPAATCWANYEVASTDSGPVTSPPPGPLPRPRFWLRVADADTNGEVARYVERATISTLPADTLAAAAVDTPATVAPATDAAGTATNAAGTPASAGPASGLLVRRFDRSVLSAALQNPASSQAATTQSIAHRVNVGTLLGSIDTSAITAAGEAGATSDPGPAVAPVSPVFVGRQLIRPDLIASDATESAGSDTSTPATGSVTATLLPIRQIIDMPDAIDFGAVAGATTQKPPTSNNFHVSFEYCKVSFDRPWWDDVFVDSHGWMVFGYDAGSIASGSAATPTGEITLLTTGMVLVRNLSITANWSEDDLAALPNTTSLGPFCVAGASFDQHSGTLTRDGVQAVAWLCQVPPVLPPPPPSTTNGSGSASSGSGSTDSGSGDTSAADSGSSDTGSADSGSSDSGSGGSASADAGSAQTDGTSTNANGPAGAG